MEKVVLLVPLIGNMHHYPGIVFFVKSFLKVYLSSFTVFIYLVNMPIYLFLNHQPC
jgi:hypothetical protein